MANELTGDFDVVAQFAIPAANRFLAAMHRIERFPHSMAIHVDDTPPRPGHVKPTVVGIVDSFGDTTVDPGHIRRPDFLTDLTLASDPSYSRFDRIVNPDLLGINVDPIVPSHLKGRAQLQLSPPRIEIPDASGTTVKVRLQIMSRYFADPNTDPAAEFARGELQLTAAVAQSSSQVGNVVDIGINSSTVSVNYTPAWSSRPLSAEDLAGINLLIRNALKTSFLPSNTTLPPDIRSMQFKALAGGPQAIAVLLKLADGAPSPATVNNVFLGAADDFGFAVGVDFIRGAFQPMLDAILSEPVPDVSFSISSPFYTWHITYQVTLTSAAVDLQPGKIVLTIRGSARTGSWTPDFDFTVTQIFTLQVDGPTASLAVGDLSLDTDSWIVDRFKGGALAHMRRLRDSALTRSDAQGTVRRMLNANDRLGGFLRSLLTPPNSKVLPQTQGFHLWYAAASIRPAGIVLHGSLSVADWPPPHVEFEQVPPQAGGPLGGPIDAVGSGPEYSALKSWIPGGVIESYEWRPNGLTQPGSVDTNKFVRQPPEPELTADVGWKTITGYAPLCLKIRGFRLSASGPVRLEAVNATVCGYDSFPIVNDFHVAAGTAVPMIALAQPGAGGSIEVVGHAPAGIAAAGRGVPNLIVHFAGGDGDEELPILSESLRDSRRADAPTAIVAVLRRDQLERARYTPDVVYTDEQDGAWQRLFGVQSGRRPATFIVGPRGNVAWQHEGPLDRATLTAALRTTLIPTRRAKVTRLGPSVRIGHPPPNFLFEYAPGRELTLRKLTGQSVVLVFWKSASPPSIETARELAAEATGTVLAINDGEDVELARKTAGASRLAATLVTDPGRSISRAYGVSAWPTVVALDSSGIVRAVHAGRAPLTGGESAVQQTIASARQEWQR